MAQKAEQEQKSGKMASAVSIWEGIVQKYPRSTIAAKGLYRVGSIYLDQGQPERALQYFDYLLYTYPRWEGINSAQVERLRALWMLGKKKEAMKEATPLWQALSNQPDAQVRLSRFMADVYRNEKDTETAFEWLWAGFGVARTPEEQKTLAKATVDLLRDADEATLRKLQKKNPPDAMKVFLEFQLVQLEMKKGPSDAARERLRSLLAQNPTHPLVPEIQAALRGAPAPSTEATAQVNPNRVGCLVPLSGQYEKYGRMVLRGFGMALDDWRSEHGNQQVTLAVKDAQGEGEAAVKAFESLSRDEGVLAVLGPLGVQSAKVVAPVANKWGIPLLSLTQRDEDAVDNSFVVHIFLDNRDLVRSLVQYCRQRLGYTRFATLYPEDRYGQRLAKIFSEVVKEEGGELLASVAYKDKTTDFKEPLQKVMTLAKQNVPPSGVEETPFEALFVPDQVQTVSLIAPQMPYYNVIGATLIGTNLWGEAPLVQAGGAYVEQAIFATPFFAESNSPRVQSFKERYEALYHSPPSYLEAQAYDAMMLLLEARSSLRGSTVDRNSFLNALLQIRGYQGVTGEYSFTPEGKLNRDYLILQVQNGQLVQVSP